MHYFRIWIDFVSQVAMLNPEPFVCKWVLRNMMKYAYNIEGENQKKLKESYL